MEKIIKKHGKYAGMFPMEFECDICGCVFVCPDILHAPICVEYYGEGMTVMARSECPECHEWTVNEIDDIPDPNVEKGCELDPDVGDATHE